MSKVTDAREQNGLLQHLPHKWRRRVADLLIGRRGVLVVPAAGAVVLLLLPLFAGPYWIYQMSLIAVFAMVVSGLNLSFGYAGEVQFGQVFMFALGGYVTMVLATRGFNEIIPLLVIGGLAAAAVGFVIALPALRIGGWSLAMASFFLVLTIPSLVDIFSRYTGGDNGLIGIPEPMLFGTALGNNALYEVTIIVMLLWLTCYRNLVTSRYGVLFRVLRESPILAQSLGYSTLRLKALAYTLGAVPAGIAGCIYGYVSLIIAPTSFDVNLTIGIVAASVLGGIESVYGIFIGAAIIELGPQESLSFANYAPVAYGVFLIIAAVVLRNGLAGIGKTAALRLSHRLSGEQRGDGVTGASTAITRRFTVDDLAARAGLGDLRGATLEVLGVSKAYGGVKALDDVSLTARSGEVTALIGSNGSGKTTLLNAICAYTRLDTGTLRLGDVELSRLSSDRIAAIGVGRTFQTPIVPRGLSVLDTVAAGRFKSEHLSPLAAILRVPRYRRADRTDRREALALLELVGLGDVADREAVGLPLGMRRLLEVARALCSKPRLLLLDEPASGLSDDEVERLCDLIAAAAQAGATVMLIEHNFGFVTMVSHTAHVLHLGRLIASGSAATISQDPMVIQSYLGESPTAERELSAQRAAVVPSTVVTHERKDQPPVLDVENVESGYGDLRVLRGVSLSLRASHIEVVLGRNGVGKTTLLSAISGQIPLWEGAVRLNGEDIGPRPAYRRAALGIALVQEGKRIFHNRTVWENVVLGTHSLRLSRGARRELCISILEQFPMLRDRSRERASRLSGGQQQMLAIAMALAAQPRVLLLDEPSAGLAPAIVSVVFERLRKLADEGLAIVLVEQLAEKALRIADHVTVLETGRVAASGPPSDFHDLDELHEAYFGAST